MWEINEDEFEDVDYFHNRITEYGRLIDTATEFNGVFHIISGLYYNEAKNVVCAVMFTNSVPEIVTLSHLDTMFPNVEFDSTIFEDIPDIGTL